MEKVVVTGGLGFIGSHIAEHFSEKGCGVEVLDKKRNFQNISKFSKCMRLHEGDITSYEQVYSAFKDAKLVFHQAAMVSVQESIENPEITRMVNVRGTENVLRAAKECGVKRVVLASSSAVYGNISPPLSEAMKPDPLSPYAESKLENEQQAKMYYERYGLETICLRYFNVYGPRQDPGSKYAAVIPKFISELKAGRKPKIYGDGLQTRDFIYVKDVVQANVLASLAGKDALGGKFNIGSGRPTSIIDLLKIIEKAVGKKTNVEFLAARTGEVRHSYANVSLANKILKFDAKWKMEDGVRETASVF